jgi:hypothetical protein
MYRDDERWAALGTPGRLQSFFAEAGASTGIRQERETGGGENRTPTRSYEESPAHYSFEMPDALAHRRLGHHQHGGRSAEAAFAFDREKALEVPEVETHK